MIFALSFLGSTDSAHAAAPELPAAGTTATQTPPLTLELRDEDASAPAEAWPPTSERLLEWAQATWPEDPRTAVRILLCESKAGQDGETYLLEAANGGPMQLNQYTWAPFFEANYGWTWGQVVTDMDIHFRAARVIYDRARGWSPWRCL